MSSAPQVPGVRNLRDVGGYAADGGVVAGGLLYRAELLTDRNANESNATWTDEAADAVEALGLRLVIDLRSLPELESSPTRWVHDGVRHAHIPIDDGAPGSDTDLMAAVFSGARESFTVDDMGRYYREMLDRRAPELARGAHEIASADGPALVHCSAGKDRTGILIAMVLGLLGVSRQDILDDYVETGIRRPDRVLLYSDLLERRGLSPEQLRPMFETPRVALESALGWLDDTAGSVETYLVERGGLDPADVIRLQRRLIS